MIPNPLRLKCSKTLFLLLVSLTVFGRAKSVELTVTFYKEPYKIDIDENETVEALKVKIKSKLKEKFGSTIAVSKLYFIGLKSSQKIGDSIKRIGKDTPIDVDYLQETSVFVALPAPYNHIIALSTQTGGWSTIKNLKCILKEALLHDIDEQEKATYKTLADNPMTLYATGDLKPLDDSRELLDLGKFADKRYQLLSLNQPFPNDFDFDAQFTQVDSVYQTITKLGRAREKLAALFKDASVAPHTDAEKQAALANVSTYIKQAQSFAKIKSNDLPLSHDYYPGGSKAEFLQSLKSKLPAGQTLQALKKDLYSHPSPEQSAMQALLESLQRKAPNPEADLEDAITAHATYNDLGLLPDDSFDGGKELREKLDAAVAQISSEKAEREAKKEAIKKLMQRLQSTPDTEKTTTQRNTLLQQLNALLLDPQTITASTIESFTTHIASLEPAKKQSNHNERVQNNTTLIIAGIVGAAILGRAAYRGHKRTQNIDAAVKKLKELNPQKREEQFQEIIHEFGLVGYEKEVVVLMGS